MKKIILTEEQLKRLCDVFSGASDEFIVEKALSMEGEIPPVDCESLATNFGKAENDYLNSNVGSIEEKAAIRKMTEFSYEEEAIAAIWNYIMTNESDSEDENEVILLIRKMAKIIQAEDLAEEMNSEEQQKSEE